MNAALVYSHAGHLTETLKVSEHLLPISPICTYFKFEPETVFIPPNAGFRTP